MLCLWQCLSWSSRAPILYPMVISHPALDPCLMHILGDNIVESLEHDRHVKVYIVHWSAQGSVHRSFYIAVLCCGISVPLPLFMEPGDYRLLGVMQSHTLWTLWPHGAAYGAGSSSLSKTFSRQVTRALIVHFSAWGASWSICAKLAFVHMHFFHRQKSINSAQHQYVHNTHTQKSSDSDTHTVYLSSIYSVCYSGWLPLDHFLIVIRLFN